MAIVRSVFPEHRYGSLAARLAAAVAALALVAGCSTGAGSGMPGAFVPPPVPMAEPGAAAEGDLYMVVRDGYAENQWVEPFQKQSGCTVHADTAGSSDEMVADVKSGRYDVVSASGDASLRMIASGDVAPVDVSKVPGYAQIYPDLKNQPWNAVNGVPYGIPQGRGANVLIYNTAKVKTAPTSLGAVFDPDPSVAGHVSVYDSPITIADAALYLMHAQPGLQIKNPYALDQSQFAAAVAVLTKQRAAVADYWPDTAAQQAGFTKGADTIGTGWQVVANGLQSSGYKDIATATPAEGTTGWSDTWMVSSTAKDVTCAYKWLAYISTPAVNAQVAQYAGEAPANEQACALAARGFCTAYHADDKAYWQNVYYWTTPTAHCLDDSGRACVPYSQWVVAWNRIKQQ